MLHTLRLALLACLGLTLHATTLTSIGADDNGVGRRVTVLDTGTATATPLFDLNSLDSAFSGITYQASTNTYFAVRTDGFGNSTLASFTLAQNGVFSDVMALSTMGTQAFTGGLTYNAADSFFYALANDSNGDSELYRIDVGGNSITALTSQLGPGYTGGLTLNSADGNLYAIRNDELGVSSLEKFVISGNTATFSTVFDSFGMGFNGGLFANGSSFYALGSDMFGLGNLQNLDSAGALSGLFDTGYGFYNAGIAAGPDPVPEPATFGLAGAALIAVGIIRRKAGKS